MDYLKFPKFDEYGITPVVTGQTCYKLLEDSSNFMIFVPQNNEGEKLLHIRPTKRVAGFIDDFESPYNSYLAYDHLENEVCYGNNLSLVGFGTYRSKNSTPQTISLALESYMDTSSLTGEDRLLATTWIQLTSGDSTMLLVCDDHLAGFLKLNWETIRKITGIKKDIEISEMEFKGHLLSICLAQPHRI